jgi:predicted metal-dependent peptidase
MDRDKALNKAKFNLIDPNRNPPGSSPIFYSSIVFALVFMWADDKHPIQTAGTNGRVLIINSDFFCRLTQDEQLGLLAHEALHIAFRHIDFFKEYNLKVYSPEIEHKLWNMAGDHVINLALLDAGYRLPAGGLADKKFKNMTTVQVYRILHKEYRESGGFPLPADCDIILPADDDSPKGKRALIDLQNKITDIIATAATISHMRGENPGNLPAGVLRGLQDIMNPKIPFEVILGNYMVTTYGQGEYSFARPNRRFMPDFYLPSSYTQKLINIATAFDVSGSVDEEDLATFGKAIDTIRNLFMPDLIRLFEFDTEVNGVRDITQSTDLSTLKFTGGGGTQIDPVIAWINENQPELTLIFTDGEFRRPKHPAIKDVIWIIKDNPGWQPPYGKAFYYSK